MRYSTLAVSFFLPISGCHAASMNDKTSLIIRNKRLALFKPCFQWTCFCAAFLAFRSMAQHCLSAVALSDPASCGLCCFTNCISWLTPFPQKESKLHDLLFLPCPHFMPLTPLVLLCAVADLIVLEAC